jgi:hypothetical protein
VTFSEIETVYNRLNKSWRDLSWPDKTIALRELRDYEVAARSLRTCESDDLAAAIHLLRGRIAIELRGQLPQANEDPGLEY